MADYHSHVGIPKCLQLEFAKKEQVVVFDIERNKAFSSNCDKAGAENHYYTEETEQLLSNRVESGLAALIKELRLCKSNHQFTNCLNSHTDVLESFFKFQLQRSKRILKSINESSIAASTLGPFSHSLYLQIIDNTNANILGMLGDNLFALRVICDKDQYFVTNSLGFYYVVENKKIKYFVIPLSNKDAIIIQSGVDKTKPLSHYTLDQKVNDYFNKTCYKFERELGNGYIYAKERQEMEDFLAKCGLSPNITWDKGA